MMNGDVDPDTGMTHDEMAMAMEARNEAIAYREDVEAGVHRVPYALPQEAMKHAPRDEMVGFLTRHPSGKGHGFLCFNCAAVEDAHVGAPVYGVNLNPYKATCVVCKRVIVQGCGTELFDGS